MSLSNGEIGMARVFLLRACLGKIPKGDLIGGGPPHRKEQVLMNEIPGTKPGKTTHMRLSP